MNMEFKRKLPTPQTIRDMYPVSPELARQKQANDRAVRDVLTGEDDRLMLLIGPCSADREDAVLDYVTRLRGLQEKVKDKILLVPRVYSNKPAPPATATRACSTSPTRTATRTFSRV